MPEKKENAFTKFQNEVRAEFDALKKLTKAPKTDPKKEGDFKLLFEQNEDRMKKTEDKVFSIEKLFTDFKEGLTEKHGEDFDWVDFFFKP